MTKNEIKATIENEAAKIENNDGAVSFTLTSVIYGGKIPFATTEKEFEEISWEDNLYKAAVVIEKDKDGEVTITVDSGECYPPVYGIDEFANFYGE